MLGGKLTVAAGASTLGTFEWMLGELTLDIELDSSKPKEHTDIICLPMLEGGSNFEMFACSIVVLRNSHLCRALSCPIMSATNSSRDSKVDVVAGLLLGKKQVSQQLRYSLSHRNAASIHG